MRRLWRFALGAIALIVIAVAAGTLVPRPFSVEPPAGSLSRTILVLANPIHTDIALPSDPDVLERFGFLAEGGLQTGHPGVRWLVLGWGGREFYLETPTWSQLKLMPLLKGITRDRSVMHVGLAVDIDHDHPAVTPLLLDEAGFARLLDFVDSSFTRSAQGEVDLIEGRSYGPDDAFYEANGSFTALLGCNVWTSAALRASGVATGFWTPLPQLLRLSLALHNPPERLPAAAAASKP